MPLYHPRHSRLHWSLPKEWRKLDATSVFDLTLVYDYLKRPLPFLEDVKRLRGMCIDRPIILLPAKLQLNSEVRVSRWILHFAITFKDRSCARSSSCPSSSIKGEMVPTSTAFWDPLPPASNGSAASSLTRSAYRSVFNECSQDMSPGLIMAI